MNMNDLKIVRDALESAKQMRIEDDANTQINVALAALDRIEAAQAGRKVLTDEEIEQAAEWEYGPVDQQDRITAKHHFKHGMKRCRDNGYLAPNPVPSELVEAGDVMKQWLGKMAQLDDKDVFASIDAWDAAKSRATAYARNTEQRDDRPDVEAVVRIAAQWAYDDWPDAGGSDESNEDLRRRLLDSGLCKPSKS